MSDDVAKLRSAIANLLPHVASTSVLADVLHLLTGAIAPPPVGKPPVVANLAATGGSSNTASKSRSSAPRRGGKNHGGALDADLIDKLRHAISTRGKSAVSNESGIVRSSLVRVLEGRHVPRADTVKAVKRWAAAYASEEPDNAPDADNYDTIAAAAAADRVALVD